MTVIVIITVTELCSSFHYV